MQQFIKKYRKQYGYAPSIYEIYNFYTDGLLNLTDEEEDTLNKLINEDK